jgi:hypothetical protein
MSSMETSSAPKSGSSLKAEFQLLNATLVKKATNLEKAERQVIKYWCMWEGIPDAVDEVSIERSRSYDVENLVADLDNILVSKTIVNSTRFMIEMEKKAARLMLPAAEEEVIDEIDNEIEEIYTAPPELDENGNPIQYDQDGNPIQNSEDIDTASRFETFNNEG